MYGIQHVKELRQYRNSFESLRILERLAADVREVCVDRKWTVNSLEENNFKDRNVLGLNINRRRILIRLRRRNDVSYFKSYDEVLDTLLHELAHMAHFDHSSDFYKLWDALRHQLQLRNNRRPNSRRISEFDLQKCTYKLTSMVPTCAGECFDTSESVKAQSLGSGMSTIRNSESVRVLGGKRLELSAREAAGLAAIKRSRSSLEATIEDASKKAAHSESSSRVRDIEIIDLSGTSSCPEKVAVIDLTMVD